MIEKLTKLTPSIALELVDYIAENSDYDFYFTKDNSRIYITDEKSLKQFLRETVQAYVYKDDRGDFQGIILVWKSIGAGTKRYYVKMNARSAKIATDLLTVLTWNFNRELFVKIKKDNKLTEAFKYKGFRFIGGRGAQILLQRKPIPFEFKTYDKEEDI